MPRIKPLPPAQWPKEFRGAMAALRPPNQTLSSPPTENRPKALNVLGTMAHHPVLAQAYFTLNGHVLLSTTLTERQRELLIMRVSAIRKSGYEWAQHLFMARDSGLSDEEIGRIGYGPDAPFWDTLDAAMLRAVDELIEDAYISGPTWETLTAHLDSRQILDLICTVGVYDTLARILKSLELDIDGDIYELLQRYDQLF